MADMAASTPGPTPVPLGPYCTAAGLNEDNVSQALPSIQPAVLNYGVVCELFQFIRKKHYPWPPLSQTTFVRFISVTPCLQTQ